MTQNKTILSCFPQPSLKAVILAGGKSTRMQQDKAEISYHNNRPQQLHLADLCSEFHLPTYISKAHDETRNEIDNYPVIKDTIPDIGPLGAIYSAMTFDPDSAWLVLACDLPYLDKSLILELIKKRNTGKYATTYINKGQEFPEPLVTIYEPRILIRIKEFITKDKASPTKLLMSCDIQTIIIEEEIKIFNANNPQEKEEVLRKLKS